MMKGLMTWLLNFLATRAGAALAPMILTALTGMVAWVASHVPWLAPHVTLDRCLLVVGFLLAVAMSFVNYITTARAFKYAVPVQKFLDELGEDLGLPPIKQDGVIASVTAAHVEKLADAVVIEPTPAPIGRQPTLPNGPTLTIRKGGFSKGG